MRLAALRAGLFLDYLDEIIGGEPFGIADRLFHFVTRHQKGAARPRVVGGAVQAFAVVSAKPVAGGAAVDAERLRRECGTQQVGAPHSRPRRGRTCARLGFVLGPS